MDLTKFKDIFISETEDHLQKLNDNLLRVEALVKEQKSGLKTVDDTYRAVFDELMRSAHTIKSSAATMGFSKMAYLTHVLEDVFDYVRNGMTEISDEMLSEIFHSVDALTSSLQSIKANNVEIDTDKYATKVKELSGVATKGIGASERDGKGNPVIVDKSSKVAAIEVVSTHDNNQPVESISFVKVPIKRLDDLMDLTEELLVEKMRLNSLMSEKRTGASDLGKEADQKSLTVAMEHMNTLISNLQYLVMQSRLVPAGQIFARFPRMVRDLAKNEGKDIDFVIKGEDLEMDRSIIDKLGEPLVHMLKNAIDHGIEKTGTILLEARHDKDLASIVVEDDGSGIDWVLLVKSAEKRNIITPEKMNEYLALIETNPQSTWQKILEKDLLYNPRLSTSDVVTETSGRGVGTSVIKQFVDEIGGTISVVSPVTSHGGTRFVLNLPMTLAIIKALLVEIEGSIFAIPFTSIERSVFIDKKDIKSVANQDVAVVGDTDIPLLSMDKIFNSVDVFGKNSAKTNTPSNINPDKKVAVLVRKGTEIAGLIVDRLVSEQEIIVKPLPDVLKNIRGFSGSTILGGGDAVLILDVISFI